MWNRIRPYLLGDILRTKGVLETINAYFLFISIDILLVGVPYLVIYAILRTSIEFSGSVALAIQFFAIIIFVSLLLVAVGYTTLKSYKTLKYVLLMFTPPYTEPQIAWETPSLSSNDGEGCITADSIESLSFGIGMIFFWIAFSYWVFLGIALQVVSDPVGLMSDIYDNIPRDVLEFLLESTSNYTGISFKTAIEETQNPAEMTVLVVVVGPMILFSMLILWNVLYGSRLKIRKFMKSVE